MSIYEKLNAIQTSLKAPKTQNNEFGGYKYRSCEDILEAVKPLLASYKAVLLLSDELIQIGERYYIKAVATFADTESPELITVTASAREELTRKGMDSSQITGATSSYARKYALSGLFAIDDTRDADTMDNRDNPKSSDRQDNRDNNRRTALTAELKRLGVDINKIAIYFKLDRADDLTNDHLAKAYKMKTSTDWEG